MTPGLVGFSGNSWNRHGGKKKRRVKVTEMKRRWMAVQNEITLFVIRGSETEALD